MKLRGIDWDKFWSDGYDSESGLIDSDRSIEEQLVEAIRKTVRPNFRK